MLNKKLSNGQLFMLMEQTPSQQNWAPYNSFKRPGVIWLQSYQSIAHGADKVMFFELRPSIGTVIEHVGNENMRVFRECSKIGNELKNLWDKVLDSRLKAKVPIILDWWN